MNLVHREPTKEQLQQAFTKGIESCKNGLHPMQNPYGVSHMKEFCRWDDGYRLGIRKII